MKRRKLSISLALGALIAAGVMVSPASAAVTTGTWTQYPTGVTEYQAEVQQPINSANTSNWSAKSKGGIPIMYKLSSRTGPAVFESVGSDGYEGFTATGNFDNDFAFLSLNPSPEITFANLTSLSTKYTWVEGDCHGGSLRWQVRIDSNGNGIRDSLTDPDGGGPLPASGDPALQIYYGSPSQFGNGGVGGCNPAIAGGVNQSGTNMIGLGDLRYDTSQFNNHVDFGSTQGTGTFYDSYANALALFGGKDVLTASLIIDSGWQGMPNGDQRLSISDTTVNDNVRQWDGGGTGAFAPTCNLPNAFIDVTKLAPVADGIVNETTVYPQAATDTDKQFRVVDCKYQYVLSIPSLKGVGNYDVEILIGGSPVDTSPTSTPPNEVRFDLK